MSRLDSPLRGSVLFVTGAPRSGTTWVAHVLGRHPDVAENGRETHLFDRGVNALFDNHQEHGSWNTFLREFVSREELADLVRDLCDGVLLRMRAKVKPAARMVLEKTPASTADVRVEMGRKLEVYPDARYLHVIRDGRAVADSLRRMPWAGDRSAAGATRVWRRSVEGIRAALSGAAYREVRYERLLAEPVGEVTAILGWLGLDASGEIVRVALADSATALAPSDPAASLAPDRWRGSLDAGDLEAIHRDAGALLAELGYSNGDPVAIAPAGTGPGPIGAATEPPGGLMEELMATLKARDGGRLRALTTDDLRVEVRSGAGELSVTGDAARWAVLRLFDRVMDGGLDAESWVHVPGNPAAAFLEVRRPDGERVDLALLAYAVDDRISGLAVVSAGDPGGRVASSFEV